MASVGLAFASPAFAQSVYLEGPGVSVGVGNSGYYRDYDRGYYRDYDRPRYGTYSRRGYAEGCRTITIERDDGSIKRVRRCD